MTRIESWMLPEGVEEILPDEARAIERLRRQLLDMVERWGYELVIPPTMEFANGLLPGLGEDLANLTFHVVDQLSGQNLALRSDMTPQTARMDAHSLKRAGVNRLCYAGHVLFTRPRSLLASRNPLQLGVELFGEPGIEADLEVISLLLESLARAGLPTFSLDLGHVGVFRSLAEHCGLSAEQEQDLFQLLQAKAVTDLAAWVAHHIAEPQAAQWLLALPRLCGSILVIDQAKALFASAPAAVKQALNTLEQAAQAIVQRYPGANLYIDLGELRGYHYHTGLVFAAFADGVGREIASGGRYDHIGQVYGRARPATGFTLDLILLSRLGADQASKQAGIFVAADLASRHWDQVQSLRASGERVVCGTPAHNQNHVYLACDRQLVEGEGALVIQPL